MHPRLSSDTEKEVNVIQPSGRIPPAKGMALVVFGVIVAFMSGWALIVGIFAFTWEGFWPRWGAELFSMAGLAIVLLAAVVIIGEGAKHR